MDLFILDEIDLNEISGVDDPAQPTAKATIIKRAGNHIKKSEDIKLTPEEIEKKVSDAVAEAIESNSEELKKSFGEDLAAAVNAAFDAMSNLDAPEFELFKAKSKDEKDELMKLTPEERKKKLKEEKEADEVVKFEGKEIAKSAVGDVTFALYKRLEAMDLEVAKSKEAEITAKLEKRASEEFGNLAGTDSEKAAVLKAVEGLDAPVREAIESIMKTANEFLDEAFVKKGSDKAAKAGDEVAKTAAREEKISEIMKSNNVSRTKAMEVIAAKHADLI